MHVTFQYRLIVNLKNVQRIIEEYRDFETYSASVHDVSLQTIYDVCTEYNVTELQTLRIEFQKKILDSLVERLERGYTTNVRDVQIRHVRRPAGFEDVIRGKEAARQKIEIARLERERILSSAQSAARVAEAQANLTLAKAELEANLTLLTADTHGRAIYDVYTTESDMYRDVMVNLNLTVAGVVSYLSTRMVQYSEKPIFINMDSPAYTNYRNQTFAYERDLT